MIHFVTGDIFQTTAEAIINPVNCIGIMGAGLARSFKEKYPENYQLYRKACMDNRVRIGRMYLTKSNRDEKYIINFPTKIHWKACSELSYIVKGLASLVSVIADKEIGSVAIPKIGCGLGGLDWNEVRQLIIESLGCLKNVEVYVYE